MSAQSSSQQVDEKELLDWGARIGVAANRDKVRSAQLENLIASLDAVSGREALLATAAFALRQAQRGALGFNTANLIRRALIDLYGKGADKEHARKMLGFAKWVFEAEIPYGGKVDEQLTLHQLLYQSKQQQQKGR